MIEQPYHTDGSSREPIPLDVLQQAVNNGSELDVFDLVAHVAFDQKPLTQRERANRVKKRDVLAAALAHHFTPETAA